MRSNTRAEAVVCWCCCCWGLGAGLWGAGRELEKGKGGVGVAARCSCLPTLLIERLQDRREPRSVRLSFGRVRVCRHPRRKLARGHAALSNHRRPSRMRRRHGRQQGPDKLAQLVVDALDARLALFDELAVEVAGGEAAGGGEPREGAHIFLAGVGALPWEGGTRASAAERRRRARSRALARPLLALFAGGRAVPRRGLEARCFLSGREAGAERRRARDER